MTYLIRDSCSSVTRKMNITFKRNFNDSTLTIMTTITRATYTSEFKTLLTNAHNTINK
jgi:hypothetical protein